MVDLIDDPIPGENAPEFSVSELSGAVKRVVEGEFGRVRVRGEVGRVFRARSGHLYYDLKDDKSVLACTTWKGQISQLAVVPEEGLEVVATGRLTTFAAQSKYNMNVDDLAVAGVGALMAMLEKRKKALEAEGLFAAERKKPLPFLPEIIGVVTSPSGAVIRDILHRLRDRFPRKVLVWPVAVQGERCAPEVTAAINGFNALTPGGALPRPDLIIVARGGGSIEDLWGFNEENVARAAAASEIPLISAVGHEADTTLIDFASDQRAPTPTAAAELAVPVRLDLMAWVEEQGARLSRLAAETVDRRRQRLADLSRALPRPEALLSDPRQRLDSASDRLPNALRLGTERKRARLADTAGPLRPGLLSRRISQDRDRLTGLSARLAPALSRLRRDQVQEIARNRETVQALTSRLGDAWARRTKQARERLEATDRLRLTLGYEATLDRGYAVVRSDGALLTTAKAARSAEGLEIQFKDGRIEVPTASNPQKPKKPPPKPGTDQGSLF